MTPPPPKRALARGTMRRIVDGDEYTTPATIDDPATLDEMEVALRGIGYARPHAAAGP
jgi:propionyl-CoA synthetase